MRSSLPVSLVFWVRLPLGLPNRFPSDFLRAKASVVRIPPVWTALPDRTRITDASMFN